MTKPSEGPDPVDELVVLPADVVFIPVSELPARERETLEAAADDYVVYRSGSRAWMKLVSAKGVELLQEFRQPIAVLNAVTAYSRKRNADPKSVLQDALPLLRSFLLERLLVLADASEADRIEPDLAGGDRIGSFSVVSCVQVSSDTELYQGRDDDGEFSAIKLARAESGRGQFLIEREASALERAGGVASPRMLEHGLHRERPYVAMQWCPGAQVEALAREYREYGSGRDGRKLLDLCVAILDAYGKLHQVGIIHGDVHPNNVLVDETGTVTIVDFELAQTRGESTPEASDRGGVAYYFEPEYAAAYVATKPVPHATEWGEQYSLAVLLYLLLTGTHYLAFSPYRSTLLEQIAAENPRTFSSVGVRAWPEVETVLARALAKDPQSRFSSVAAFARALSAVEVLTTRQSLGSNAAGGERFVERIVARLDLDGPLIERGVDQPPTASVNYGAAGVAYALYRMACARDDPDLLAAANVWLARAHEASSTADGFRHRDSPPRPANEETVSLYHSVCGLHVVEATLGRVEGNGQRLGASIASFVSSSRSEAARLDLTLGEASVLLSCAILRELAINEAPAGLIQRGYESLEQLARSVLATDRPPVPDLNWGMAHGWAGVLYAILRWCDAAGKDLPAGVELHLDEVAGRATRWGRGLRWPWVDRGRPAGGPGYMPGWCNGSAGFVHLWLLAHRLLGGKEFMRLAEGAAWHAWETPEPEAPDLCCGLSGRAYALLALYRHTDDADWLAKARQLADRAVVAAESHSSEYRDSLYRGDLGVAVLVADLMRPDDAAMPLFESERWPKPQ